MSGGLSGAAHEHLASELAGKANRSDVDARLRTKADGATVFAQLEGKVERSEVERQLELKANRSAVTALGEAVSRMLNASEVAGLLAGKLANLSRQLELKADLGTVSTQLQGKETLFHGLQSMWYDYRTKGVRRAPKKAIKKSFVVMRIIVSFGLVNSSFGVLFWIHPG